MLAIIEQSISLIEWNLINDLNGLPENKDIIIDFLLERLQHGQIYTWVDSLLLTLNPNNEALTSHLYHSSKFDKQIATYETSPHIFTIAAKAHYNLIKKFGQNSQVIIISGETGTGKTFNVYKCLEFFSNINKASVQLSEGDYMNNIMLRITDACHLISVFTTACTEKNEISSRHGELIKLYYKNNIIGATINSFLLERNRVTRGSDDFQIFYQMIFGISETELKDFYLSKDKDYDILSSIDYEKKKYFQNDFQYTLNALDMLDFKPDQKKHIFQILALLIHMGNIKFIKNSKICIIDFSNNKSKEALKNSCILDFLIEDTMIKLLIIILINPQSIWRKYTSYHRYLVTIDAYRNRLHSIIRYIYDLLFHWILNHANNILSLKQQYSQWLGILDIFGFESFNKNGMEQIYVNYVNEKMQQYFIESYVKNSHDNLQEENFIEICNPLHTINLYKECLNVIEENLFLILNDACQSFVVIDILKIIQLVYKNLHNIQKKFLNEKEGNFIIEHYSGPVAYSIENILFKNIDKVPSEISLIFSTSKNKFLQSLINIEEKQYLYIVKFTIKKKTMLAKLKYNMDILIKELSKCDLHYVRCLKPNRLINQEWNQKDFQKQLACSGIFDVLSLAKCKYPIHFSYRDFYFCYSKKFTETINFDKCKLIVESVISKKDLQTQIYFGKQLIFLIQHIFFILESYKRNYHIKCVHKIQEFWMRHKCKITLPILKYLTNNCQIQNVSEMNKNIISVKIILDHELKKLNTSEKNNNIFFINSIFFKNNDKTSYSNFVIKNTKDNKNINIYKNLKIHSQKENKNDSIKILNTLEKIYVRKNSQTNLKNFNYQFNPIYIKNFIKNDTSKFMRKININNFLKVIKYSKNIHKYNDIMNNCNNNNNNLLKQYLGLHVTSIHIDSTKKNYEKKNSIYHKTENTNLIQMDSYPLFYKNGILSRRRLTAIPIKMHIRTTCLINSHILPRNKLPQGLQDCL